MASYGAEYSVILAVSFQGAWTYQGQGVKASNDSTFVYMYAPP